MSENTLANPTAYTREDSLNAGLQTSPAFAEEFPNLRVSWILWDSGFRGSGLQVADRIVAVDGIPVVRPGSTLEAQTNLPFVVGQLGEAAAWRKSGKAPGDVVTLTIRRRVFPGDGWTTMDLRGTLQLQTNWRNGDNRPVYGPGGPETSSYEFSPNWEYWYDTVARNWSLILDEGLIRRSMTTDYELRTHLENEARVQALVEKYPGPFAAAVKQDFDAVRDCLTGRTVTLAPDALNYRDAEARLKDEIAETGRTARAAFLAAHASELIPAFPAVDPDHGDIRAVEGKLVELPSITQREWISQGPRTVLVVNQGDGSYFIEGEGEGMQRALVAQLRYERLVSPYLRSSYQIIGRVLAEPSLVIYNGRGCFGLKVAPVAVTVGEAFFVDVTVGDGEVSRFAGEEPLLNRRTAPPADNTPPRAVLEAFLEALKNGDRKLWETFFAGFSVFFLDNGLPRISPGLSRSLDSTWESARRLILDRVYDVRVVWCSDVRVLVSEAMLEGAPRIEEVTLEVDHIGRMPDGSYRSFCGVGMNRLWRLQRLNGSPWRLADERGL